MPGTVRRSAARSLCVLAGIVACGIGELGGEEPGPVSLFDLSRELRHWGVDEGLPMGRVDCMAQTPDGYLWVGGRKLLARFNGHRFENFDPGELLGDLHEFITHIVVSEDGSLWACSSRGQFMVGRGGVFRPVDSGEHFAEPFALAPHPDGGVVAALAEKDRGHSIFRIDEGMRERVCPATKGPRQRPISLTVTPDRRMWMVNFAGRLFEVTAGGVVKAPLDDLGVGHFFELDGGGVGVVGRKGVYAYRDGVWESQVLFEQPLEKPLLVADTRQDSDGYIWFVVRGQDVWLVTPGGDLHRVVSGRDQIPLPVTDLVTTDDGNLWLGSYNGFSQLRYSPFVNIPAPQQAPSSTAVTIAQDGLETIWITYHGAVCARPPRASKFSAVGLVSPRALFFVAGDPGGGAWCAEVRGRILRIKGRTQTLVKSELEGGRTGLVVQPSGVVWVATAGGMMRHDPDEDESFLRVSVDGAVPQSFQQVALGPSGQVYVASKGSGIFRLDEESGEWGRLGNPGHPATASAHGLTVDPQGGVWTLSERGARLGFWSEAGVLSRKFASFGGLDDKVVGLALDHDGGVWLATETIGVAHVGREDLLAALRDPQLQPDFTWFDKRHGLGSKDGPFWPEGIFTASDGNIWVATGSGASVIDPEHWKRYRARSSPPQITIESCSADGAMLPLDNGAGRKLRLPEGADWLRIEYNVLDYGRPGEATFRYRLRGMSDKWVEAGPETSAVLNQLPAGDYQFEVVAANRFGQWSGAPAVLSLTIPPRWWQTTPFRAAIILAVLSAVATAYLLRVRHLKRAQRQQFEVSRRLIQAQEFERKRIAAELHDGLGQNLTVVKNQLTMSGKNGNGSGTADISEIVSDMIDDVRRMSHALRPYVLDRLGLTRAVEVMVGATSNASGLEIDCHCDNIDGLLSGEDEINLFRVVQESLNNILKHADASKAAVELKLEPRNVSLAVQDDGRGFEPAAASGGMGLSGIRERVRIMGGAVTWKSARRAGTTVHVDLPLQVA